jgi:hypothetical protein
MTIQTLYFRGDFPQGDFASIPPEAIRDAAHLLSVDPVAFERLISDLQVFDGFVDQGELTRRLLPAVGGDDQKAKGIARFVDRYHELIRTHSVPVSKFIRMFLDGLRKADPKGELIPADSTSAFCTRLEQLFTSYPGYLRQAKAEELAKNCGTPIERVEIILDLRPVFDSDRTTIEGVIPVSRLRIVSTAFNGLPVLTEVVLTEHELEQLENVVSKAKAKLNAAKKAVTEGLRSKIPNTRFTESSKSRTK